MIETQMEMANAEQPASEESLITFRFFNDAREYKTTVSVADFMKVLRTGKLGDKLLSEVTIYEFSEIGEGCTIVYSFDKQKAGESPWQLS